MSIRLGNTDRALRRAWHPVARSTEVGTEPVSIRLLGEDWVLVRLPDPDAPDGTRLAAFVDVCPHRLAPLSAGTVVGNGLRCGYHGWCFDADGHCVDIPALGGERIPSRADLLAPAALTEHQGLVFLAPEPPLTDLLHVSEADDPTFVDGTLPPTRARVGAGLMIDNFLDMAHFPFVHAGTIGSEDAIDVPDFEIERTGYGMRVHSRHWFPNHEDPAVERGERDLLQERILTYEYRAPFLASLRIDYVQAGGTNVVTLFVQPEDDEHSRLYATIHRDDLGDEPARMPGMVAYEGKILEEDLVIQERYRDRRLPLDLTDEVHIKADRSTIELRRILADLVAEVAAFTAPA